MLSICLPLGVFISAHRTIQCLSHCIMDPLPGNGYPLLLHKAISVQSVRNFLCWSHHSAARAYPGQGRRWPFGLNLRGDGLWPQLLACAGPSASHLPSACYLLSLWLPPASWRPGGQPTDSTHPLRCYINPYDQGPQLMTGFRQDVTVEDELGFS